MNRSKPMTLSSVNKRFSLHHAIRVCGEVEKLEAQMHFDEPTMLNALRELAEVLVYTDKHDEMAFDHVMCRDPMNTLERIATNADASQVIKIQVMQCLTIIFQNLTRVSSVYLAFSNNHLNRIIALEPDASDDELTSMYISLLKSLALRVNKDTAQLFFETSTGAFPLFDKAVKLLESSDQMVRTAARQIVVTIAHLEDNTIAKFLCCAMEEVYVAVAKSVVHQLIAVGKLSQAWSAPARGDSPLSRCRGDDTSGKLMALQNAIEDIVDDFYYINDLFHTPQLHTAERLVAVLSEQLLQPIYMLLLCELDRNNPAAIALREIETEKNDVCASEKGKSCTLPNSSLLQVHVPAATALGFLARWAEINDAEPLHNYFAWIFLCSEAVGTSDAAPLSHGLELSGVVGAILRSDRASLYQGALLLWSGMRTKSLSESMHLSAATLALTEKQDLLRDPLQCALRGSVHLLPCENVELGVSRPTPPPEDFFSPLSDLGGDDIEKSAIMILRNLFTVLYFLVRKPFAGSLADLYLAVKAVFHELTRSPPESLRLSIKKMAGIMLDSAQIGIKDLYETYSRLCLDITQAKDLSTLHSLLDGVDNRSDTQMCVITLGLHNAQEALFLALKRAWAVFESYVIPCVDGGVHAKDSIAFLPLSPSQAGPVMSASTAHDAREALPLFRRPPLTVDECETKIILNWLLLRRLLSCLFEGQCEPATEPAVDPLEAGLRRFSFIRQPNSLFQLPPAQLCSGEDSNAAVLPPSFYCEFVMERSWGKKRSALVAAGSGLRVAFTEHELLLCSAAQESGGLFCPVVCAWDLAYVRAAELYSPSFRMVVEYHEPLKVAELHLTFRTAEDSKTAVNHINTHATRCRLNGVSMCCSFLALTQ